MPTVAPIATKVAPPVPSRRRRRRRLVPSPVVDTTIDTTAGLPPTAPAELHRSVAASGLLFRAILLAAAAISVLAVVTQVQEDTRSGSDGISDDPPVVFVHTD